MSKPSITVIKSSRTLRGPTKNEKEQNKYFATNALLVSALLPLIPSDERLFIHEWLKRLYSMGSTEVDRMIRNDYIWFLLVQLESGKVTLPFIEQPKRGHLGPVAKSVNKKIYEEILQAANKKALQWEDERPVNPEDSAVITSQIAEYQFLLPSEFQEKQPKPKCGFIVYGSCFSNQNYS